MRDLYNNLKAEVAFDTAAISTDTTTAGNIIDLQGFNSALFVIQSGTLTDGVYSILIEDGDVANLSDAAAVADSELLGTEAAASFTATDDDAVKKIGYKGNKRYVRLSIVSSSTTTGGTLSAVSLKGDAADKPVA